MTNWIELEPEAKAFAEVAARSSWLLMQVGLKGACDCIKAFSETDLTEDLKKFNGPTLVIHGDDDQIVPIAASALLSSRLVKNATLKIYRGPITAWPLHTGSSLTQICCRF